jgi:dihydrodipicolinate synthase/N-acetylneuraminate lyase
MQEHQVKAAKLGVVPVMPIPFDEKEEVDEHALRRLVDFAVACKVKAICLPMYASEFYKLSDAERTRVVAIAVDQAAGRVMVIGNAAHGASRLALAFAQANVRVGADMISVPVPRTFPVTDEDLLNYLVPILHGVDLPVLLQDYNPGGRTVSVEFVVSLLEACPNFRYLKLEEPLMANKVSAIRKATRDRVGFLEGWGGLYMMELIPAGIVGSMPGLAIADVLSKAFELRLKGDPNAFALFEKVLPQIVFALQNFELFLYCEKRLLHARGLLSDAICRRASYTPDPLTVEYVDELNDRLIREIDRLGLQATQRG